MGPDGRVRHNDAENAHDAPQPRCAGYLSKLPQAFTLTTCSMHSFVFQIYSFGAFAQELASHKDHHWLRSMPQKFKGVSTSHLVSVFTQIIYRCDAPSQFASWSEMRLHNSKSKRRRAAAATLALGAQPPSRLARVCMCKVPSCIVEGHCVSHRPSRPPSSDWRSEGRLESPGPRFGARQPLSCSPE